jgi:hypothetical protein
MLIAHRLIERLQSPLGHGRFSRDSPPGAAQAQALEPRPVRMNG